MNEFPAQAGTGKRVRAFTLTPRRGVVADGVLPEVNLPGLRMLVP